MATIKLDPQGWKGYRSRYRVEAQQIAPEGVALGVPVTAKGDDGEAIQFKTGDYAVRTPEGRIEFWTPEQLNREMELDATATPEPLTLEVPQ